MYETVDGIMIVLSQVRFFFFFGIVVFLFLILGVVDVDVDVVHMPMIGMMIAVVVVVALVNIVVAAVEDIHVEATPNANTIFSARIANANTYYCYYCCCVGNGALVPSEGGKVIEIME